MPATLVRAAACATLFLLAAAEAAAGDVDPARSEVVAVFTQMNVPVEGRFEQISGEVDFAEQAPAQARATVSVQTASFDLGDDEYNAEVRKAEWLDSETHPTASFDCETVRALGDNRFEAQGRFTLKGRSVPMTVIFEHESAAGGQTFEGRFALSRRTFGIGDADWDDVLDDEVIVRFRIFVAEAGH